MFLVMLIVFGKVFSSKLTYVRAFVHVIVQFTFSPCPVPSVQSPHIFVGTDQRSQRALTVSVARARRSKYMNLYLCEHVLSCLLQLMHMRMQQSPWDLKWLLFAQNGVKGKSLGTIAVGL